MNLNEERRLITILFADLSGFTTLAQHLDPEEVSEVINICFGHLNPIITHHGGVIHKYEGDLVIALFGLPVTHEDDPERAVRAAIEMMASVPEINASLLNRLSIRSSVDLHIGISSGVVFVGEVGSREKHEYTVMGEVVNLASRLKDTAKAGEILIAETIYRLTHYLIETVPLPPVKLKGIEGEVRIFKVLGLKSEPEPERGIRGLSSPLVGRDREFALLKTAVERLTQGKGGIIFIIGDPGIGKSRLFEEIRNFIITEEIPITIFEGRCLAYGENLAYHPFLPVLRKITGITEKDSVSDIQNKLIRFTAELFPDDYKSVAPYIGYLFSIRYGDELDEKVKYLDPKGLRYQIFLSIKRLLFALAQRQPLLLVIEDYHWIDTESLELLEFIYEQSISAPMLMFALSRFVKEKIPGIVKERLRKKLSENFTEIILRPLDRDAGAQLLYNLLNFPDISPDLKNQILMKADGNPYFVEEIIRSLIDTSKLKFTSGRWKAIGDFTTITIPDTIQLLLTSRIDQLDDDVRNVLQQASIIGRIFDVELLELVNGANHLMLSLYLATLEEFGFIMRVPGEGDLRYQFRHPLLYEVVYNSILKKNRRSLHRKVGELIENIHKERLDDWAEALAHQYGQSDNYERAMHWLMRAGYKAKGRYANDEAISFFEKLIAITTTVTKVEKEVRRRYRVQASEALGELYFLTGRYDQAIKNFEMMRDNAQSVGDRARAQRQLATIYQNQGQYDFALQLLDEIEKSFTGTSLSEILERVEIMILRGWIYWVRGMLEPARAECEEAINLLGKLNPEEQLVKALKATAMSRLGLIAQTKGEYEKAIAYNEEDLRLSREIANKKGISRACCNLGSIYKEFGQYDRAIEYYDEDLRISEEIGDKQGMGITANNLGTIYLIKKDYDRAQELFQKYLIISQETGYLQGMGTAKLNLGSLALRVSEIEDAEKNLLEAEAILKEIGYHSVLITVYILLAELYLVHRKEMKKAWSYLNRARQLNRQVDSKSQWAKIFFAYGKMNMERGEWLKAGKNFDRAVERFLELGELKYAAEVYEKYAELFRLTGDRERNNLYSQKAKDIYKKLGVS